MNGNGVNSSYGSNKIEEIVDVTTFNNENGSGSFSANQHIF